MIEAGSGVWAVLAIGMLLGFKHATDADHVVAVATFASENGNAWRGLWVGASWGLGHTTPLLALGIVILVLKEALLDRYEAIAPVLEFGVGVMLVFLGAQVFYNLRRGSLHLHEHAHEGQMHVHVHSTHREGSEPGNGNGLHDILRPQFRLKSYGVGMVHGLAGSAAVMLVLLPQIEVFWVGLGYLVLFGVGTVASMSVITIILGVPFAVMSHAQPWYRAIAGIAGAASLLFGVALMTEIATGVSVIPF
ncbi:MAG: hypothetical protein OXE50_10395 [Chloroflexi bacterium]|nr:hypothetical protein [Chloroflexota bacterium]